MKKFYSLIATTILISMMVASPGNAANEILTSLHGKAAGLDVNGDLIIKGEQVTNVTAADGAKNGSTVVATVEAAGAVRYVKLTCTATPFTLADSAGSGQYGGVKVYDLPAGLIMFLGGVVDGAITLTEAAWTDTFDGDIGIGTAVHGDAAGMNGTAQDLIQATALTQAVAQVATCDMVSIATALTESGARWHDGTATAKDVYFNIEIDDSAAHTAGNGTFTGTIEFAYIILGDN